MSQPKHPIPPQPTQHQTTPPPPQTATSGIMLAVRLNGLDTTYWTPMLDYLKVLVYVKSGPAVEDTANDKCRPATPAGFMQHLTPPIQDSYALTATSSPS